MKKKLLAGILALALCSTNILPQTVFAEEFTSGNPEEVSEEETLEVLPMKIRSQQEKQKKNYLYFQRVHLNLRIITKQIIQLKNQRLQMLI